MKTVLLRRQPSLNLINGFTGQFSIGHAAFMALGGYTAALLFSRLGIDDAAALRFAQTDTAARPLVRLPPGRFVQAAITSDAQLDWLKVHSAGELDGALATARTLTLARDLEGEAAFRVTEADTALERRIELKAGEVRVSLFGATCFFPAGLNLALVK